MIKIAIIEDDAAQEAELRAYLTKYFSELGRRISITSYAAADAFLAIFERHKFNMSFMDIEMPGTNGMEASRLLRRKDEDVLLFFVTNLAQYALESYEVSAFDYVVKPVNYYNLALKMKRALRMLRNTEEHAMVINAADGQHVIQVSDIRYVEVMGHNVTYHTVNGDYFVGYGSLKAIRAELEPHDFVLCDRSFLVNLKYVTGVNKSDLYVGNDVLKIAKSRRSAFMLALTKYFSCEE